MFKIKMKYYSPNIDLWYLGSTAAAPQPLKTKPTLWFLAQPTLLLFRKFTPSTMTTTKTIPGKFMESIFGSDNDNDALPNDPAPEEIENHIRTVIDELGIANVNINYIVGDLSKTFGVDFSKRKDIRALIMDIIKPAKKASPKKAVAFAETVPSSVAPEPPTTTSIVESVTELPPPPPPSSPEIVAPTEHFTPQQVSEIMDYIHTSADIGKKLAEILNVKKRSAASPRSPTKAKKAKTAGGGRGKRSTKDRLVPRADSRCMFISEPVERYCVKSRNRGTGDVYCATHKYRISKDLELADKQERLLKQHRAELDANAAKEAGWIIPAGETKPMTVKAFGKLVHPSGKSEIDDGRETPDNDDNEGNEGAE